MLGHIKMAELRYQDIRAETDRYWLANQATPIQPAVSELKVMSSLRTLRALALSVLGSDFFHFVSASEKARNQAVLTVAR